MKKILSLFALLALTCSMYATEVTVTKTVQALKDELGWSTGGATYPDFVFSESISVDSKASNNGAVYSGTPIYWRCYQTRSNGQYTIKANDGCVIKSVKFAYSRKNNGTLAWKSGSSLLETDRLIQNTAYEINAQSVTIYTGSTGTNTDGQVNITQFTITYDDPNVICEKFSGITRDKAASVDTKWQGDLAEWSIICARRKTGDAMVDGTRATWTSAGAYMKMTAEGGIKHLCFNWSQMATAAANYEIKMGVAIGTYDSTSIATTASTGVMKTFDYEIACKENALLTLTNASDVDPDNKSDRVEFGNIIITPYLFFDVPNHKDTIDFSTTQSYNLGAVLINNTGAEPTYEVVSNSTGCNYSFTNGVITLSDIIGEGDIQVKASWNEGKVYTTMNLHVKYNPTPEAGQFFEETFAAMTLSGSYGSQSVVGDSAVYGTWYFVASRRGDSDVASKEFRLNSKNAAAVSSADALEGGIKDVYFTWRIAAGAKSPVNLAFSMEAIGEDTVTAEMTNIPAAATESHPSVVHLNVEKNAQFKLEILSSKTSQVSLYSPLKIVPYLLFTVPNHKVTLNYPTEKTYNLNAVLINNTGAPANYEVIENTTGCACAINDGVLDLSDVTYSGYVKVKASWNEGKVYTTLSIYVGNTSVTLDNANLTINDATYTPSPTGKQGSTAITSPAFSYESSSTSVAVVDGQNIRIVGAGSTTITTTMAPGADYLGAKTTSTLTVAAVAPAENTFWKETFKSMETGDGYNTGRTKIVGDSTIYTWYCQNYMHNADDDKVEGELGVRLRYNASPENYMEFDGNQEGGIKDLYFKWRLPGNSYYDVLYNVEVYRDDNLLVERTIDIKQVQSKKVKECQQKLDIKQNAKLKIHVLNGGSSTIFGPISVTPYLLYKKKFIEKKLSECEGTTFKNSTLINNTNGCGGTIYYKSSDESVATVDNSGDVSVKKASADTITITAIWKTSETDSVTTSYRLKINDREKRQVYFEKSSISLKVGETPVNNIEGTVFLSDQITYSSADEHVAKVVDNVVTVVGIGETTIFADIAKTPIYMAEKISYKLIVAPKEAAENILVETFTGVATDTTAWSGDLKKYGITWTRSSYVQRRATDLIDGKQGTWMMQSKYITSDETIEGGVKHFYARWIQPSKEPGATLRVALYLDDDTEAAPATGDSYYSEGGTPLDDSIFTYAANPNCDRNAKLTFKNISSVAAGREEEGRIIFDQFNIVPYLFYTKKADTIHVADYPSGTTYQNTALIDNTDDSGNIQYSILGENTSSIATINQTTGVITVVGKGEVTVQAKWHNVTTTYTLTIEKNTKVSLMRNDGTEDKDEIVMEYNATFPNTFAYPTRDNYMFNAYFENAEGGQRYTVTVKGGVTKWVSCAGIIDSDRKWIYEGKEKTMYALWKPVVTIALDNQGATTAGTEEVKTANCPKNENIYLTSIDERPTKTGYVFGGYYTEAKGKGSQIIDATGAFIADVSGYTNGKTMWQKNDDTTTLYAKWTEHSTVVLLERNDDTGIVDTITATYSKTMPAYSMPSRENYKPNAFFTNTGFDNADRLTVTNDNGTTKWVANRPGYIDNGRKWINTDDTVRLYLQWGKQCTITLDNQSATTAGTESIVTYNCPNNAKDTWLPASITKPAKEDGIFQGYYTSENGQGAQIIGADGKCLANVSGYTDANKCWIYGEDATLFAHWQSTTVEIILNDKNAKNDSIIAANDGKTANVSTNRTITGGMFNTICLPFNVDAAQMAEVFGEDYQLVEFTSATLNENENELNIRFNTVDNLEAGVPYLIKTSATKTSIAFQEVQIVNTTGTSLGEDIKMYGIMSPTVLGATEKSHLIVVANDMLSWVKNNDTDSLKGMRAYLKVENAQMQAAIRRCNPRLVLNGTDITTEAINVNANVNESRKLLINGQLFIERQNRLYNVLGY